MSLADYLAKNYLTADKPEKSSKKKKRKERPAAPEAGILVEDDAATNDPFAARNHSDDETMGATVAGRSQGGTGFPKTKKSGWKTVGQPAPSNSDQAAADMIIANAEAERKIRADADEAADAPQIVGDDDDIAMMANGAHAGLQTAAQVGRQLAKREREERARFEAEGGAATGKNAETIYRDATGRIINVAMKRAEARKKQQEEERRKEEEKEAMKGDVQRREKEERMQKLSDARLMGVARYADDEEMNDELKEQERWQDPALGFLTKKKDSKSKSGKPLYRGNYAPNRYGIRPGHRWDGVDRSNGFEKEYFAAQNRRQDMKNLAYAWQMDE